MRWPCFGSFNQRRGPHYSHYSLYHTEPLKCIPIEDRGFVDMACGGLGLSVCSVYCRVPLPHQLLDALASR